MSGDDGARSGGRRLQETTCRVHVLLRTMQQGFKLKSRIFADRHRANTVKLCSVAANAARKYIVGRPFAII